MIIAAMVSVWILVALHDHIPAMTLALFLPLVLVMWGLKLTRASSGLRGREATETAEEIAGERALQKRFTWIFAGEGIAIFLAVNVLANIGESAYLLPTIGVIVGLHFMPLAKLYDRPLYAWSGAIQIVICLITALVLKSNLNGLRVAIGLEMAFILWSTMLLLLIRSGVTLNGVRAESD